MTLAKRLMEHIQAQRWQSDELVNDDYVVEINPLEDKIQAGFALWRKLPDGGRELLASGHTYGGQLVDEHNLPLTLNDADAEALDLLLGGD